jgi:hypothetical protein
MGRRLILRTNRKCIGTASPSSPIQPHYSQHGGIPRRATSLLTRYFSQSEVEVIQKCLNQACDEQWKLFGTGALYALEKRATDSSPHHTEFFWLCPSCIPRFAVCKDSKGQVVALPRTEILNLTPPDPDGDLRLVFYPEQLLRQEKSPDGNGARSATRFPQGGQFRTAV